MTVEGRGLGPVDGIAVLLHLIEAARAWSRDSSMPNATALAAWTGELETWLEREVPVEAVGWEARRWREVTAGDRVSLRGIEAVVESALTSTWHVDPRNAASRWAKPKDHDVTMVRLEGRDRTYRMLPDGEVEVLRGAAGRALDEMNGRSAGMVAADRAMVLGSWAEDALLTLEAAGLSPEPMAMDVPEVRS